MKVMDTEFGKGFWKYWLLFGGYQMFAGYWLGLGLSIIMLLAGLTSDYYLFYYVLSAYWAYFASQSYKCASLREARKRNSWGHRAYILLNKEMTEKNELWMVRAMKKNLKQMEYWRD